MHAFRSDFPSSYFRRGFLTSQRIESKQQFNVPPGCNLIVHKPGRARLSGHTTVLADIYKLEYFRDKQSLLLILKTVVRSGDMEPAVWCCMITVRWRASGSPPGATCPVQLTPPPPPPYYFENSRWSGKMPFLLWLCSFFPNAKITGI